MLDSACFFSLSLYLSFRFPSSPPLPSPSLPPLSPLPSPLPPLPSPLTFFRLEWVLWRVSLFSREIFRCIRNRRWIYTSYKTNVVWNDHDNIQYLHILTVTASIGIIILCDVSVWAEKATQKSACKYYSNTSYYSNTYSIQTTQTIKLIKCRFLAEPLFIYCSSRIYYTLVVNI